MQEYRILCKSKIQGAVVTKLSPYDYTGSITIDEELLKKADILKGERVQVLNINTGARLDTYVIVGPKNSGIVELNGPAARFAHVGDKLLIISYCILPKETAENFSYKIIYLDENNRIISERMF